MRIKTYLIKSKGDTSLRPDIGVSLNPPSKYFDELILEKEINIPQAKKISYNILGEKILLDENGIQISLHVDNPKASVDTIKLYWIAKKRTGYIEYYEKG